MALGKLAEWLGFRKEVKAPPDVRARFLLKYLDQIVGTLSVEKGIWSFEYSKDFKDREMLRSLVEFPDLDKKYQSPELWQFFASRIPSPEQADIEEILRREHIPEDDAVSLLRRFGKQTVANPFHLEEAAA